MMSESFNSLDVNQKMSNSKKEIESVAKLSTNDADCQKSCFPFIPKNRILPKEYSSKIELNGAGAFLADSNASACLKHVFKFLDLDQTLQIKNLNKHLYQLINRELVGWLVRNGALGIKTRTIFWKNNIDTTNVKALVLKELNCPDSFKENLYSIILDRMTPLKYETNGIDKHNRPLKTPFAKSIDEISRDLGRTFHEGKFLHAESIESLERILCAISFIRPEIGYCQGMNFVAGGLIQLLDDEELAFWIFLQFLDDSEMNSLYFENMPDYSIRIYQLNYYLKKYLTPLYNHFRKHQINPDLILSKWILTIFSSYLPFDTLGKVWDIFILDKWKSILIFSLVFLKQLQDKFLKMDLQKISKFIRENCRKLHTNINDILLSYNNDFQITNEELIELRQEYFKDLALSKIKDDQPNWDTDQTEAVNIYDNAFNNLQLEGKAKLNAYKKKFEYYSHLNQLSKDALRTVSMNISQIKVKLEELLECRAAMENVVKIAVSSKSSKDSKKATTKLNEITKEIPGVNSTLLDQVSLK